MKKFEAVRDIAGALLQCAIVLVPLGLLAWAAAHYPVFVGLSLLLLAGLLLMRARKKRNRTAKLVDTAFSAAYGRMARPPSLVTSSSYGYPAFEIRFPSKDELKDAAQRNAVFKDEIDKVFVGYGPRSRPFSAEMAVFFTYDGYLNETRTLHKTT